jgi:predicted secreted Zn-dependent protease
MQAFRFASVALVLLWASVAQAQGWTHVEKIQTYAITGRTGIELYRSIGENGPKAGTGRAIAITDFELKWSRDYQPRDGGCILVSAKPHLTIVYRLPKPSNKLPEPLQPFWNTFIRGVEKHERVHGAMIVETVKAIEAATVGTFVPNDPKCRAVRKEVERRTVPLVEEQRRQSRAFDREELSDGGNVHSLILGLVNGPAAPGTRLPYAQPNL